jgi:hypothetical protein
VIKSESPERAMQLCPPKVLKINPKKHIPFTGRKKRYPGKMNSSRAIRQQG